MDVSSVASFLSSHPDDYLGSCGQSCSSDDGVAMPHLVSGSKMDAKTGEIMSEFDVLLYPNPFNDQFHIKVQTESTSQVNLRVLDLTGKVIKESLGVQPGDEMLMGNDLASGVYLIQITQDDVVKVIKMVKQTTY
jgi:hypothetical protein